jgi:hypothetical protein
VPITSFQSNSWPAKIRVRAIPPQTAPRKPHNFPARYPLFCDELIVPIGWRPPGSSRRIRSLRAPMDGDFFVEVMEK